MCVCTFVCLRKWTKIYIKIPLQLFVNHASNLNIIMTFFHEKINSIKNDDFIGSVKDGGAVNFREILLSALTIWVSDSGNFTEILGLTFIFLASHSNYSEQSNSLDQSWTKNFTFTVRSNLHITPQFLESHIEFVLIICLTTIDNDDLVLCWFR